MKLKEIVATRQDDMVLADEAEIDGKYAGGHVRCVWWFLLPNAVPKLHLPDWKGIVVAHGRPWPNDAMARFTSASSTICRAG